MKYEFDTTDEIRRYIEKIGRTEDVKISPDNKRFIIAEFLANKLHLFSLQFNRSEVTPTVNITRYCQIRSPEISHPHGVCFLGNNRIVVCNRSGDVSIFKLPDSENEISEVTIEAETTISGSGFLNAQVKTPGSVDSYQISENKYRIFVCNNHWHMITSHIIDLEGSIHIENEGVIAEKSLRIPDGISVSPGGKWIAVSNHVDGQVVIYENTPDLNPTTAPSERLTGLVCPHGIRFSPDGRKLYVADAASQYLYIFESESGTWENIKKSPRTVKILNDETFNRGRYGAKEGGIKGIDIDKTNSFLITTHKDRVIGFYDLQALNSEWHEIDPKELDDLCRQRDETFRNDDRLNRRWTLTERLTELIIKNKYVQPANYKQKISVKFALAYLEFKNRSSDETFIDPTGPVVSLTTHGNRIDKVFYTLESIRRGEQKPSRIILWLNEDEKDKKIPDPLTRLKKAGLEICYSENLGPHTKYYPYVQEYKEFTKPLVTADDDVIYPSYWLKELVKAYDSKPGVIHCYRCKRMRVSRGTFTPYNDWEEAGSDIPSHLNFITGVSGVLYPPEFLSSLKWAGDGFRDTCPRQDDVWLTLHALKAEFKIAQIYNDPKLFMIIPGSQGNGLYHNNVNQGGTHRQLVQTFTEEDIIKLERLRSNEIHEVPENSRI